MQPLLKKTLLFFLSFVLLLPTFTPLSYANQQGGERPVLKVKDQKAPTKKLPKIPQVSKEQSPFAGQQGPKYEFKIKPTIPDNEGSLNSIAAGAAFGQLNPDSYRHDIEADQNLLGVSADDQSGALNYSIPIVVPPGRNGMQPGLSLSYSSQDQNLQSPFGYGWSVAIPYIQRLNKTGVDELYENHVFSSSLSGELVSLNVNSAGYGSYAAKTESGDFLTYDYESSTRSWVVKDKVGKIYRFGSAAAQRQDDSTGNLIYKWMLSSVEDANGNMIRYRYHKDSGQIYPDRILYTGRTNFNGDFSVRFLRQLRPDSMTQYSAQFPVETRYRIHRIETRFENNWVRRYNLNYVSGDNQFKSLLRSVTESGRSRTGVVTTLPATTFDYGNKPMNWSLAPSYQVPVAFRSVDHVDKGVRIADINGDGLDDLVQAFNNHSNPLEVGFYLNKGDGTGWQTSSNYQFPENYPMEPIMFSNLARHFLGVQLLDVNGDTYPDLVQSLESPGRQRVFLHNGVDRWIQDFNFNVPFIMGWSGLSYGFMSMDVNGDGLVDYVQSQQSANQIPPHSQGVYMNNGDGTGWSLDSNYTIPVFFYSYEGKDFGVRPVDVNSDGLPDLVHSYIDNINSGNSIHDVYLNKGDGTGWVLESSYQIPADLKHSRSLGFSDSSSHDLGVRPVDVNGDGLIDLVRSAESNVIGSAEAVYYNKGNGEGWQMQTGYAGVPENFVRQYTYVQRGVRMLDANGDGLPDIMRAELYAGQMQSAVYLAEPGDTDVLTNIHHGTGAHTSVSYKNSTAYRVGSALKNPGLPYSIKTVEQVTVDDGNGVIGTTTYDYEGGSYYYETPQERRVSGFKMVTVTDPAGHRTKTYYHQGNETDTSVGETTDHRSKIGRPYKVERLSNSGDLYTRTFHKWEHVPLGGDRFYVKQVEQIQLDYDGNADRKARALAFEYDNANGNLIRSRDWGSVVCSNASRCSSWADAGADDFEILRTYVLTTSPRLIGLVARERKADSQGSKVYETETFYDSQPFRQALKGNATAVDRWIEAMNYTHETAQYNSYGLATERRDANGQPMTYHYDSRNLYPAQVVNALGHTVSSDYDYGLGVAYRTTDANGAIRETTFDGLDRPLSVHQNHPQQVGVLDLVQDIVYNDSANPRSVRTQNYLDTTNAVQTYSYLDGLDRTIQTRREDVSNQFVVQNFAYNSKGELQVESLPFRQPGHAYSAAQAPSALRIHYQFDALGRLSSKQTVVGLETATYDQWQLQRVDALGRPTTFTFDAQDRLRSVEEYNLVNGVPEYYTTQYRYDGNGNLKQITDADGNIKTIGFDGLNRKRSETAFHRPNDSVYGTYTYEYDDAGNLTDSIDARGVHLHYEIDLLNRIQSIRDFTVYSTPQLKIAQTFKYDTCNNGVGRLCTADVSGESTVMDYDKLGRIYRETKKLDPGAYGHRFKYDRQGNLTELFYPDGTMANYEYNRAGQISLVELDGSWMVAKMTYNPLGQPQSYLQANDVATIMEYDPNELYRLRSKRLRKNKQDLQQIEYLYDSVGNLTTLTESGTGGFSKRVNYQYDDLDRLVYVDADDLLGSSLYTRSFDYTPIGNIHFTSSNRFYSYDGHLGMSYASPHAVTSINGVNYKYDENGNLTHKGVTDAYEWNAYNRMSSSDGPGGYATYTYDHKGQRMTKTSLTSGVKTKSVTPSKYVSVNNGDTTYNVYAGDLLVATVDYTTSFPYADTYYPHNDHLSGTNVVTDAYGNIAQHIDYYPFGETRINQQNTAHDQREKFTGYELDSTSNLYYANARYYDGAIGRFISVDPWEGDLTDPQTLNKYSYVLNNPLKYVDPTGEKAVTRLVGFAQIGDGFLNLALSAASAAYSTVPNPISSNTSRAYSVSTFYSATSDFALGATKVITGEDVVPQSAEGYLKFPSKLPMHFGKGSKSKKLLKQLTDVSALERDVEDASLFILGEIDKITADHIEPYKPLENTFFEPLPEPSAADSLKDNLVDRLGSLFGLSGDEIDVDTNLD